MKRFTFCSAMALLFGMAFTASAIVPRGQVTNPGTVVDANGKPVKSAYISYMSLGKRFTWSYSDSLGRFGIPSAVLNQVQAGKQKNGLSIGVEGSNLSFFVTPGVRATVELFDLKGRSIGKVLDRTMDAGGEFSFSPFTSAIKLPAQSLYVARVTVDGKTGYATIINQSRAMRGQKIADVSQSDQKSGKILAVIDTLRVGKTEYFSTKVPISNYTDVVGTIRITKMDVNKKVDSIFALMTPAEKGMAVTLGNFGMGATASGCGLLYAGAADGPSGHSISGWMTFNKNQANLAKATRLHIPVIPASTMFMGRAHATMR